MKKRVLLLRLAALLYVAGAWLGGIAIAEAHDCSSPGDCEQTGGYNGALSAAGGAIAIGTALIGSSLLGGGGAGTGGPGSAVPPPPTGGTVIDTRVISGPEATQTLINNGGRVITVDGNTFIVPPDNFPPGIHGGGWETQPVVDPVTGRVVDAIPPGKDPALVVDWPHPSGPPTDAWVDPSTLPGRGFPTTTIGGTTYVQPPENLPPNMAGGAWGTTEIPDPNSPTGTTTVINPNEPTWVSEWPPASASPPPPPSLPPSVPVSLPDSLPQPPPSVPDSVPISLPESVPPPPLSVPESVPVSLPESVPPSVPESVPVSVPQSVPPSVPESVPPSVPESTPASVPESPPASVPESTPASVPESVPEYVPPGVETLDKIKNATDNAKDFVDKLNIDDKTKQELKDRLDQVGEPAGKGSEYIKALDDNLKQTEGKGYPEGAREFLAWWRVLSKGAGEGGEKYFDSQLSALPDGVKEKIHDLVPIKEFGEELGKFPTSAARHIRGGVQGEANRAENRDILDEINPNTWGQP